MDGVGRLGGVVAETFGLRITFALAALVHAPLLVGFLGLTEDAIAAAEQAPTSP